MRRLAVWGVLYLLFPAAVAAQELPQKYALLIGIDRYMHESRAEFRSAGIPALQFAARDAKHLKQRLESQGYITTELSNEYATRRALILNLLRMAEIVRPEDTFVLYYAGHGVRRQKTGTVYWLNHDGDPVYPDIEGIRVKSLIELVNEIPARRKLVLLDHCYAGQLEEVPITGASEDDSRARSGGQSEPRLVMSRDALPVEVENVISQQASGMAVVAASRGLAFEVTDDRHGVFTAALLSAITTARADLSNQDGNLSVGEIIDFVYQEVQRLSRAKQFEQKPVSQVKSANEAEMRSWQPLMRNLRNDEVPAAAQRFRTRLGQWASQGRIPQQVLTDCEGVISRWEQSPDALAPIDEGIIFLLRQYLDSPPAAEEALIAAKLAEEVEYFRGAR
ncbi:MAG: caspase family protein [Gammaproteobacteria bacterium]